MLYPPFKKLRSSVSPSVRPSVRSVLGLMMGKFWQISTELRPLIDVRNWCLLSIFGIPLLIFFKLGMRVDIVKECFGIADG